MNEQTTRPAKNNPRDEMLMLIHLFLDEDLN